MKFTLVELKVKVKKTHCIMLFLQSPIISFTLYPDGANQTKTFILATGVSPYTSLDHTLT